MYKDFLICLKDDEHAWIPFTDWLIDNDYPEANLIKNTNKFAKENYWTTTLNIQNTVKPTFIDKTKLVYANVFQTVSINPFTNESIKIPCYAHFLIPFNQTLLILTENHLITTNHNLDILNQQNFQVPSYISKPKDNEFLIVRQGYLSFKENNNYYPVSCAEFFNNIIYSMEIVEEKLRLTTLNLNLEVIHRKSTSFDFTYCDNLIPFDDEILLFYQKHYNKITFFNKGKNIVNEINRKTPIIKVIVKYNLIFVLTRFNVEIYNKEGNLLLTVQQQKSISQNFDVIDNQIVVQNGNNQLIMYFFPQFLGKLNDHST